MGTDDPFRTSTQPGPCVLLASELTDCLAQRFLNRARCLALVVSGENIAYVVLPRMWRPELASVRNRVANNTQRIFYETVQGVSTGHLSTRVLSISLSVLDLKVPVKPTTTQTKEKHLSQEGLMETVGFEKAHFRMP